MITREEIMEARKNYILTTEPVIDKLVNNWAESHFDEIKNTGASELTDENSTKNMNETSVAEKILDFYYDSQVSKSLVIRAFAKLGLYVSDDEGNMLISFKPA